MKTLTLIGSADTQKQLATYIQNRRKHLKLSRVSLADRSGVPASTIKKFETTAQISLRQFILLWQSVDRLEKLTQMTKENEFIPKTMKDIINHE